jgi:hypothetical protein
MADPKITGGIPSWLRQEFRELEALNEITRLKYLNQLPMSMKGVSRKDVLREYQLIKGPLHEPEGLHESIRWRTGDAALIPAATMRGKWQLVGGDVVKGKKYGVSLKDKEKKRTVGEQLNSSHTSKRAKLIMIPPRGLLWDRHNYSCAYDALFTILYDVWRDHGPKWFNIYSLNKIYLNELGKGFKSAESRKGKLETARNSTRKMLARDSPELFPTGDELSSLDNLANQLVGLREWGTTNTKCTRCNATTSSVPSYSGSQTAINCIQPTRSTTLCRTG